jgi:hypothetical protein
MALKIVSPSAVEMINKTFIFFLLLQILRQEILHLAFVNGDTQGHPFIV